MEEGDIYGKEVECGEDGERTSLGTENEISLSRIGTWPKQGTIIFCDTKNW